MKPPDPTTMFLIGVGLSVIAGLLLKPKTKSPIQDDKPTTLTTRGSYMSWFIGIRRVGPVFAWAGDREKRKERSGGGKGVSAPKVDVWYESGWHQIGVGPCTALLAIVDSGKTIFTGPITPDSHPSGSTVELDDAQAFTIYWGELDQPVNSFLADAGRVGVSSRWPFCCYVVWNKKRLGSSPNWPVLDYVMERRPSGAFLSLSDPWYEPSATLGGGTATIVGNLASASPSVGYIQVSGDFTQEADPGRLIQITGNSLPDGNYFVLRAEAEIIQIGTQPLTGLGIYATYTKIYLQTGTAGSNSSGTVTSFDFETDDGANIAHATADMLFAEYPQGLELDPDGPEPWDLESLEALGQEAETELWRASLVAVDGELCEAVLAGVMQDHGTLLPIDVDSGNLLFQRCREPSGTLPNISADLESEKLPEIESLHAERPVDVMVFEFTDRDHEFSSMTIGVSGDGQISYMMYARPRNVGMSSTVHFNTAAKLSELRSQEELAGAGRIRMDANRGARYLVPGDPIVSASFDEVLRVIGIRVDPLSEAVALELIPDFYWRACRS